MTVTNLANGLTTTCTVDDRGPAVSGRIIDLSEETFSQIADPSTGVIEVQISW
ncbi:MAG TPA: septal ring lytic transglycosylase RlpA family protein [Acidimicrobiales bacterium]|nr:septal ring lytic transglycosylase RlpA family protein [Acidimicrobiales bacterium]